MLGPASCGLLFSIWSKSNDFYNDLIVTKKYLTVKIPNKLCTCENKIYLFKTIQGQRERKPPNIIFSIKHCTVNNLHRSRNSIHDFNRLSLESLCSAFLTAKQTKSPGMDMLKNMKGNPSETLEMVNSQACKGPYETIHIQSSTHLDSSCLCIATFGKITLTQLPKEILPKSKYENFYLCCYMIKIDESIPKS